MGAVASCASGIEQKILELHAEGLIDITPKNGDKTSERKSDRR